MPNTREKLIELCERSLTYDGTGREMRFTGGDVAPAVRSAIAKGVTVQEWIPVTERLPEDDSDVLACLRVGDEGRIYPANYAKGVWFDCIFNTPATDTTTHWMPLPQPPKT